MSRRVLLCGSDPVLTRMLAYELRHAGLTVTREGEEADCALVDLDTVSLTALPTGLPAVGYTRGGAAAPPHMPCLTRPLNIPALIDALSQLDEGKSAPAAPIGLQLDDAARTVSYGRACITLMPGEYALLRRLVDAAGEPVSREALLAALPAGGERSSNLTEVLICTLRRRLESAFGLRPIRTVRGIGYRLEYEHPMTGV